MVLSLFLAYLFLVTAVFGYILIPLGFLSLLSLIALLLIFVKDALSLKKTWDEFFMLMGIFFVRTTAWVVGIPTGILYFLGIIKPRISGYDKKSKK